MDDPELKQLPRALKLALAYTPLYARDAFAALLQFDRTFGQLVSTSKEPILAQMKLAWWRDMLAKPVAERPRGNPTLTALGDRWLGEEAALTAIVDGWEELLGEAPLSSAAIAHFAEMRGGAFAAFARVAGAGDFEQAADRAGRRWALADFTGNVGDATERQRAAELFAALPAEKVRWPRVLRGVALLDGLARRATARGDGELLGNRSSALAALRLGLFGR